MFLLFFPGVLVRFFSFLSLFSLKDTQLRKHDNEKERARERISVKAGTESGKGKKKKLTLEIRLRTSLFRSRQGIIDERVVFAQAGEIVGLAACGANGGEGGTLLDGGRRGGGVCFFFPFFSFWLLPFLMAIARRRLEFVCACVC